MLVNASQHAGPALWQGLMLMVVAGAFVCGAKHRGGKYMGRYLMSVVPVGVVLAVLIIAPWK